MQTIVKRAVVKEVDELELKDGLASQKYSGSPRTSMMRGFRH